MDQVAAEAGCDVGAAYRVADLLLRALHQSALINGLSGSLHEAFMLISTEAAYHLGGIYAAIGEGEEGMYVSETLLRLPPTEGWEPYRQQMDAWEKTLTDDQRDLLTLGERLANERRTLEQQASLGNNALCRDAFRHEWCKLTVTTLYEHPT